MSTASRPFDLIILDLDGTILDENTDIGFSSAVRRTIAAVQAAEIPVTVATGRTLDYVHHRAPELNLTHPAVTAQGAVIGDPVSGRVLDEFLLPVDAALEVARWAETSGRVVVFYCAGAQGRISIFQNLEIWSPAIYDHWFGTPRTLQPRLQDLFVRPEAHPPIKFIVVNDPAQEPDINPLLQALFGHRLHISRTHSSLVEGTAQGVDKGEGVKRLLALLDIDPARVMAIGDNQNDIPMLKVVGFAVAMGHAAPEVKAAADWVAPSLAEDGAAVALQRFVLDKLQ